MLSDNELTHLLRSGDAAAFSKLYYRYSAQMYCNVLKLIKDEAETEEIVQAVFSRIWERREFFFIETTIAAYLYKTGQNQVRNFYRKLQRDQKMAEYLKKTVIQHYSHIEEALHEGEHQEVLQKALAKLSPQQKRVYQLCKIEGHSYKQAAEIMNISTHTVKEYLSIATHVVKDFLLNNSYCSAGVLFWIMYKQHF